MAPRYGTRQAATFLVAALLFSARPGRAANPSMSEDFALMMRWLSHEMAQGLAFNAGFSFDPPRETLSRRLRPELSAGGGIFPLDKTKFPEPQTPALKELNAANMFPSSVLFPNAAVQLRAGLPGRSDAAVRFTNLTTPPGYKVTPATTGKGQSNSFGLSLRKHFWGDDRPLLSFGANYNHLYGRMKTKTKFKVERVSGFSADSNVEGGTHWNINSFGVNAVASQNYGGWTPFVGFGFSYLTGSVRATLEAIPNTPLILPIRGEASDHPEQNQGRLILGAQFNRAWGQFFANSEIKTIGIAAGKMWIINAGMALPFGVGGGAASNLAEREGLRDAVSDKPSRKPGRKAAPAKEIFDGPRVDESSSGDPTLIFIQ